MVALGRVALRLLPLGVLGLLLVAMVQSPLRIAPDSALYVEVGDLLLEGRRPYVDFIELNPPLIMYVHVVPALLARVADVHPIAAFNACVFLLIAWSTWATRRQLQAMQLDRLDLTPDLVAATWAAFSVILWLTAPWEVNDFAQREHLFVLAWLPYGLLRCRRDASLRISPLAAMAFGAIAGVGCCLKPYFLAMALAAELALLVKRRSLRSLLSPESIALIAVAALYAAHFALLPSDVREAFFGRWLPFVMRYYSVYALNDARQIRLDLVAVVAVGLAAVAMSFRVSRTDAVLARVYASLGVFTVCGVGVYYWQGKGFFYHQIPAIGGAIVLIAIALSQALAAALSRLLSARRAAFAAAAVAAVGWLLLAGAAPSVAARRNDGNGFLAAFERLTQAYCEKGEPISILSISVWPEYPTLTQLGRRQASRFLGLGYVSLALAARDDGDGGRNLDMILGELADDLRQRQPPIIFIANSGCPKCANGTLTGELRANPAIASVFAGYRSRPSMGLPGGSTLLVRADRADRDPGTVPWIFPRHR